MSNAIASLEAAIALNPYDESSYQKLIPMIAIDTGKHVNLRDIELLV